MKIILDLCGGTGSWSQPYKEAGYDVRLVTLPETDVRLYQPPDNVYGILAAPPCTEFSFAKHFHGKGKYRHNFIGRIRPPRPQYEGREEGGGVNNKQLISLIRESKYPPLSKNEADRIWKRINEKLFADALLEFKNEIVHIQDKIETSRKSHELGMKGSNSLSLPWHWHQGYRDADNWISSLLDKSFATLGKRIMGIDPVGLPLEKKRNVEGSRG